MKKVTKYVDNDGIEWGTEQEAAKADKNILLQNIADKFTDDNWCSIGDFIDEVRVSPEAIDALLGLLEIDITKLQAKRVVEDYKEKP